MKIVKYLYFWTNSRKLCWFEYQIQKENNTIITVGAFGTYRQEATRNAQKLVKGKFTDELFNFDDVDGIDIKSPMFRTT